MAVTFCTSGAVKLRAGANRPTDDTVLTATNYETFINQSECYICDELRYNFIDTYSALNADVKLIFEMACSCHAALGVINYDMSGYTSRQEAQTMLDVNYGLFSDCMALLREKKTTDFINGA